MIYFFYGTDSVSARAKAKAVLGVMKVKRPGAEFFRFTSDKWNKSEFENFIAGQGLFDQKFIVFADGVFGNEEAKEWLVSRIKEFGESENAFVFFEDSVDAVSLKRIKVHAKETEEFTKVARGNNSGLPVNFTAGDFKVFSLSDALGRRDRKELWALYTEAILRGFSPEEINGILFWQIKSIFVSAETKSASEAKLSPFVFGKSKRYSANWKQDELLQISADLLKIYHEARCGRYDLGTALERFTLSI